MLKSNRNTVDEEIRYTCENVAEAGYGLVAKVAGSGIALGDSRPKAELSASASGKKFVGILVNDVISLDTTLYTPNQYKDVTLIGAPCTILKKGYVTTNAISGTPTDGDVAYLTTSGAFTPTLSATGGLVATPKAGTFRSAKDENGYAMVEVNLPN